MYPGWTKLNDLICIKYYRRKYNLQNLIKTNKYRYDGNPKIKITTIFLGCTYAKVIKNLCTVISNLIQDSKRKFYEMNDLINGFFCTEKLINIISLLIVPLATMFKGAMDALDLLLTNRWFNKKYTYMKSSRLEKIGTIHDYLDKQILSRDDIFTYFWTLNVVDNFIKIIMAEINYDTAQYCEFVPFDTNYLWNEWNLEYKTIIDHGINLVFLKFLSNKIEYYIQTVIIQKYFQLGFKYDSITGETYITKPGELIELELELKATNI
ncbi:uncharacterized protein LOC126908166 [Daktulosphaira vitifoliae]|uniref:uncharacterized protein LOC126908166 n=1 Tax=Daktulosphaira vitifoliae TaxID=58002 RepID=UPI0021AA3020|nr:uncharacterized protein LOC126908166 [Daktulosphaira vitifoliae]